MESTKDYIAIFHSLVSCNENEVVEFKKAENSFGFNDLGKCFSALKVLFLSNLCNGTTD